jgi:hypothetical protein
MPIYKTPQIELTDERQVATQATLGEAFEAGTYTMYEGLAGSLGRMDDLRQAEGTMPAYRFQRGEDGRTVARRMPLSPLLDPEIARQQLRDNGLDQNLSVPDSGIRQATLDILMSRKKDELRRQQIMAESSGLSGFAANLTGSLVGSFVDPTNIALAFVPVVGEAKYAQLLARAGGVFGRTGVRVGVGGVEGLVGLAPVEALNYLAHQQQQSDYDAYDSMLAIAGGAAFGSALHGGAGLFSDVVLGGSRNFAPPSRIEPTLGGVVDQPRANGGPPVLDMAARERLMVLDRLAEGRPVTRAQVDVLYRGTPEGKPGTGVFYTTSREYAGRYGSEIEAISVSDDVLDLSPGLSAESVDAFNQDAISAVIAKAVGEDGLDRIMRALPPGGTDTELTVRQLMSEGGVAAMRAEGIRGVKFKQGDGVTYGIFDPSIKSKYSEKSDRAFVDGLTPATRAQLDADPFMPVRPFVATLDQKTQANALRMAVAQALSGRPIDVSPAIYGDAAYLSPDSAFAAASRNADMVDGADQQAADWAASVKPLDDDIEVARTTVKEEAQFVKDMMDSTGIEMAESFKRAIDDAELSAKKQGSAAKAAAMCMMRTGG